ncbi:MAG: hypothetical protein KatS3mg125_1869 [Lysobacterales bacterium]|jgi:hypothetical protein|nr:MAG: hypothetical protein KatS3mg125_1869 [Xanthomonadales bacterium]
MRRLRILLSLLLLLLALALWLKRLIEPDAVAMRLGEILERTTGLALRLDAEPGIELLPALALRLGPGELRDREGHPAIRFEQLSIRVSWRKLLARPLELEQLKARSLRVDLPALAGHRLPMTETRASPPSLIEIGLPIEIQDLRLLGEGGREILRFDRLNAELLHDGRPWRIEAEGEASGTRAFRFSLAAASTPTRRADGLGFEDTSLRFELSSWIAAELRGGLRWRPSSLSWNFAGGAKLGERLARTLASGASEARLASEGEIGDRATIAALILSDAAGGEIARLDWAPNEAGASPLRLSLPRLALVPLRLKGIELELLAAEP